MSDKLWILVKRLDTEVTATAVNVTHEVLPIWSNHRPTDEQKSLLNRCKGFEDVECYGPYDPGSAAIPVEGKRWERGLRALEHWLSALSAIDGVSDPLNNAFQELVAEVAAHFGGEKH